MRAPILIIPPAAEHSSRFPKTTAETGVDTTILIKFAWATLAGVLSYVAAVFTTVLELGGFWQYFWLGICLTAFACACLLVVLAGQDFGNHFRASSSGPNFDRSLHQK
jgi:hypothetical protein